MNKEKEYPLLVVLTPVFNEAWVLPAFLKATSLWADYIIIADQMSTDGSRDLYKQFSHEKHPNLHGRACELIVVDNSRKEMHQAATRRLLFEAAKKIEGDKILFALDADEFLSGNFPETRGWQTIINSEPGDVFLFRYMNITPDQKHYTTWEPYYWAAHMNDEIMNGEFPDKFIHEWRLPWPKKENHIYNIEDIYFIHFREVNIVRQRNKGRFYIVSQFLHPSNKRGGVSFFRQYNSRDEGKYYPVPIDAYAYYESQGLDLWKEVNLNDEGQHYTKVYLGKIEENGLESLRKLDIWDSDFLKKNHLKDPRRPIDKLMHWYLRKTTPIANTFCIRAIDYILKRIY